MIDQHLPSSAVDATTAAILDLIGHDAVHELDRAAVIWAIVFVAGERGGRIDPNRVRQLIPPWVYPRVIGPAYRTLMVKRLIRPDGWVASNDVRGRNAGKPVRVYRWNFSA